jgi:Ni/Co efflux regulator RcnB
MFVATSHHHEEFLMFKTTLGSVALILCMAAGAPAFAQRDGYRQDNRPDNRQDNRQDNRRYNRQDDRGREVQRPEGRHWQGRDDRMDERGAGPQHDFRRGGRLPAEYRSRQYVVDDWRGHHLSAPPRGYHWVQTGSDYVLAAIATGVILELLLDH